MTTILHVSEPGSAGVKRHVVDLLGALGRRRKDVGLVYSLTRSDQRYRAELGELAALGVRTIRLDISPHLRPWQDLIAAFRLLLIVARERPHILHLHSSKAGGIGRVVAGAFFPGVFVVYVPNAMACFRSRFYLHAERWLAPLHHALMGVSRSEREDFHQWGVERPARTTRLRMGVEIAGAPHRRRERVPERTFVVLACGRICEQKNALLFFQLALSLQAEDPSFEFVWVGDFGGDQEAEAVRALLAAAPGRTPEITGWVEDPLVHIARADLFCMFSRYESFGYVTAEAMLLGVPVLGVTATGTRDLVQEGQTGYLAEPDVDSLVTAVKRARSDVGQAAALAQRAQAFIRENHTVAQMAADVDRLYSAVQSHGRSTVV